MTDVERRIPDRVGEKLPSRVETYTDNWADAARAAYPEYKPDPTKPDLLAVVAVNTPAEQLNLPGLEIVTEAPAAPVDPALAKVEQIAAQLKSDDFATREQASFQLKELLRSEVAANKPSAALQRIFQLGGSDDPEVKNRVNAELDSLFKDAMDSKDLVDLKQLLTHQEPAVRDWAIKNLQDSPKVIETLPKLAVMAEKEKNTALVEAIRAVAKPYSDLTLFGDFIEKISEPTIKAADDLGLNNGQLSQLSDEQRKEAIKKLLADAKSLVKTADDSQQQDIAALARVLYPLGSRAPEGSFAKGYISELPFRTRFLTGRALTHIAQELKNANKDPEAVNLLQETAISLYKESLALSPSANFSRYMRNSRYSWPPLLDRLRDLNPTGFDELVPDRLLKPSE